MQSTWLITTLRPLGCLTQGTIGASSPNSHEPSQALLELQSYLPNLFPNARPKFRI